jgi:hypothetical protein
MSWNGSLLGTEWRVWCPSISAPPTIVFDTRTNGTGIIRYETSYTGGHIWFSQTGSWGNGEDYNADIDEFNVTSDHIYQDYVLTGINSNISLQGHFTAYSNCFTYSISNAEYFGDTNSGTLPAEYPSFLEPTNCQSGFLTQGAWGEVHDITVIIYSPTECTVKSQDTSWGAIKALYKE